MPKKTVQWDSQENKPKKSRYTQTGGCALDKPALMLIGSPLMETGHRKSWDDIRRDATRFAKDWRLAYDEK